MSEYAHKNILIAGLGTSGMAAARLLAGRGGTLFAWDAKESTALSQEDLEELGHLGVSCLFAEEGLASLPASIDLAVTSPGLPPDAPVLARAKAAGAEIIGELELAYRCSRCPFIGITGTNGKTTVTSLIGDMFRLAGLPHAVAGNIGRAASDAVLHETGEETMIVEVSSFQLETIVRFRPRISVMLNIAPDHMDRHGTLEEYTRVKFRMFENQKENDACVYNADDALCARIPDTGLAARAFPFSTAPLAGGGAFVRGSRMALTDGASLSIDLGSVRDLKLPGSHNVSNALAAAAAAYIAGVPVRAIRESLRTFSGLPHRIAHVADIDGVSYIDDSKGTNPAASVRAIQAVSRPIILIAGGYEKQADFGEYTDAFPGRVRHVLLMGATAERIAESALKSGFSKEYIHRCADMEQCVREAAKLARPGDAVLLSPACASWGQYANFEERGRHFASLVLNLDKSHDRRQ